MLARDGVQRGPFTSKALQALATSGELLPTDLMWKEGMKEWVRADRSSLVFPQSAEERIVIDVTKRKAAPETPSTQSASHTQDSLTGLRGIFAAVSEAWRDATQETQGVMIEDLAWFQKKLAELLATEEVVHIQLEGLDLSGLVCTDRQLIIFHTTPFTWMLGGMRTFQASYEEIDSVALIEEKLRIQPLLGGGYVFEVITPHVTAGATVAGSLFEFAAEPNRLPFGKDKLQQLRRAEEFIRARLKKAGLPGPTAPARGGPGSTDSVVESLRTLAELRAQGLLTDDEYATQKQKVLERM